MQKSKVIASSSNFCVDIEMRGIRTYQ